MTDSVATRALDAGVPPGEYTALVESELLRLVREARDRLEAELAAALAVGRRGLSAETLRADRLMKRLHGVREIVVVLRKEMMRTHWKACPSRKRRAGCGVCDQLSSADQFLGTFRWD